MPHRNSLNVSLIAELMQRSRIDGRKQGRRCRVIRQEFPYCGMKKATKLQKGYESHSGVSRICTPCITPQDTQKGYGSHTASWFSNRTQRLPHSSPAGEILTAVRPASCMQAPMRLTSLTSRSEVNSPSLNAATEFPMSWSNICLRSLTETRLGPNVTN
jgi:hypothetical protein